MRKHPGLIALLVFIVWLAGAVMSVRAGVTDFSQTVISAVTAKNIDIAAVIHWYYAYLVIVCPVAAYAAVHLLQRMHGAPRLLSRWRAWRIRRPLLFTIICSLSIACIFIGVVSGVAQLLFFVSVYGGLAVLAWRVRAVPWQQGLRYLVLWGSLLLVGEIPVALVLASIAPTHVTVLAMTAVSLLLTLLMAACADSWATESCMQDVREQLRPWLAAGLVIAILAAVPDLWKSAAFPSAALILCFLLVPFWRRIPAGCCPSFFFLLSSLVLASLYLRFPAVPPQMSGQIDLFEGANQGISVYAFLSEGKLPFLQTFDAHMFSMTGLGLLYGWASGAVMDAYYMAPVYLWWLLASGAACCLFRCFFSEDIVAFLLLFTPLFSLFSDAWFVGLGLVAYFLYWMQHAGWRQDIGFAACFLFICLFRLDVGFSWGLAFEAAAVLYLLPSGRRGRLLPFLAAQLLVGMMFLFGLGLAAAFVSLDIGAFLRDFRAAASSNQHWSSGAWGGWPRIALSYFLLPILPAALAVRYARRIRQAWDTPQGMALVMLALAGLLNAQRTLVRHTLMEDNIFAIGILPILFSILLLRWMEEKKEEHSPALWLEGMVLLLAFCFQGILANPLLARGGLPGAALHAEENYERTRQLQAAMVVPNAQRQQVIDDLSAFFQAASSPGQTYLDFTDQTLLYAYLGKENLAYVNQVPAMLNGKDAQLAYLANIESHDVPYALLPLDRGAETAKCGYSTFTSIDGIQNTDRFYLLAEYIGEHYEPYAAVGDFAIWRRKELAGSPAPLLVPAQPLAGYGYATESYYQHNLGWVPYIWGTRGSDFGAGQPEPLSADHLDDIELSAAHAGGLMIEAEAPTGAPALLAVETLDPRTAGRQARYAFRLKKGTHRYYLRISSDFLWYAAPQHRLHLQLPKGVTVRSITWLSGTPSGGAVSRMAD